MPLSNVDPVQANFVTVANSVAATTPG